MPRRGLIARRELQPDPLYNSTLVTKFINSMMYGGKRSTSQRIMYDALSVVQQARKSHAEGRRIELC